MRRPTLALFSGIGRRVTWAIIVSGLAVLALGLFLQAGKQQRQFRDQHQQQLRQAAVQSALLARSRIASAETLLRTQLASASIDRPDAIAATRAQLQQVMFFSAVIVTPAQRSGEFSLGPSQFELTASEFEALQNERSLLLAPRQSEGRGRLFLMRQLPIRTPVWVLAELNPEWLWSSFGQSLPGMRLLGVDSRGQVHTTTGPKGEGIAAHVTQRLPVLISGTAGDIALTEQGQAWVGALARVEPTSTVADAALAMVVVDEDRPWSVAFWSALRTQSTMLPLLLVLAMLGAHVVAARAVATLRQLRRGLFRLPEQPAHVPAGGSLYPELRQVVEAFNTSAEAIENQAETGRMLEQIDAVLLPGGDYEGGIDQVLSRVRAVTRACTAGLTLVDPGVAGHARLFAVNAKGGFPVNRVVLDIEMVATLRETRQGLTIARCEEGRHSFLEPLQAAGCGFFWVWPVMVAGELVAILSLGYSEPPEKGARIVHSGTQCAQRLGVALSNSARAERLYRQAHFDPLTQLPNRLLFRDQLGEELQRAAKEGTRGALLYIDLDHFKRVNDSLGHEAGDQLLSIVAQRLRACVKDGDTVARLGGDEFTVILRNVTDVASVSSVADRIIDSMHLPVRLGNRDHHVLASIGVTLFPADGAEIDELLHNADLAMYRAKDLGRGGAAFYNAKMGSRAARVADSGLYRALRRREFSLFYQPQYRVSDGGLVGLEVLLRWQKPREGLVSSAEFIPAAEESGLIVDLGGWVIEAACAQIAQWRDMGVMVPRVAVNLSVQQLRDPELITTLRRHLDRFRVSPAALEFEINEAALTDPASQPNIETLSALGSGLTLDDFGTGNTALTNLRRYPVSAVKIDRSFVDQLSQSATAAALASTIIVMAHSLDKLVIAEGVESMEQLDYLRERGCDVAQGFFMASPLSAADMTELLLGRGADRSAAESAIA